MKKPILLVDFDGVIHSYTSGWAGADAILDGPVPGAFQFLYAATAVFDVNIYSSRSSQAGGIRAMRQWFDHFAPKDPDSHLMSPKWWRNDLSFPTQKPAAFLTIDDRAFCFQGVWPDLDELRRFKPWNKQGV